MGSKIKKFWQSLGPGLITGAADNDPAGVATYSIAGAQFGTGQLWILIYILPFMIAVQRMCARIGALTGCGLAGNIKRYYPKWILTFTAISLLFANIFNIGADLYGMAGALNLIIPLNIQLLAIIMSLSMIAVTIFLRYRQIENILKWFALSLFAYGIALFLVKPDWGNILWHAIVPTLVPGKAFLIGVFAILGTTISPYMFFWQASEEAEEADEKHPRLKVCKYRRAPNGVLELVERDTKVGMIASNIVSFFIMSLAASTIFGGTSLTSLREAAEALRPLAGNYAFAFFALGVVSSGLLAIPVLAGSGAYVVAELMGWPASLDKPFNRARQFYIVMVMSVLLGMLLPFVGISPIQALWWSAIINGLVAPPLIMLILHMSRNPDIVGPHPIGLPTYILGIGALFLMLTGTMVVITS